MKSKYTNLFQVWIKINYTRPTKPTSWLSTPELKVLGDIISFGPNAGRIYKRWANGKIAEKMRELSINLTEYGFRIHKYDTGEVVTTQRGPPPDPDAPVFNGHRGELHSIVFNHAKNDLGIPIHLGHRVTQYWEDEEQAGIILDDGTKVGHPKQSGAEENGWQLCQVSADVVIGADGVRSKARELVLGYFDKPKSSGYAVYRAWYIEPHPWTKSLKLTNIWLGSQTPIWSKTPAQSNFARMEIHSTDGLVLMCISYFLLSRMVLIAAGCWLIAWVHYSFHLFGPRSNVSGN